VIYAGKVDHGFDKTSAKLLRERLTPLIRKTQPYARQIKAFGLNLRYRRKSNIVRNLRKARCDTRSSRASGTTYELGMSCSKHRPCNWTELRRAGGDLPFDTTSRISV
jgi:hypothetical protein